MLNNPELRKFLHGHESLIDKTFEKMLFELQKPKTDKKKPNKPKFAAQTLSSDNKQKELARSKSHSIKGVKQELRCPPPPGTIDLKQLYIDWLIKLFHDQQ